MSQLRSSQTESSHSSPSEAEQNILKNFIFQFFDNQKRSPFRIEILGQACDSLLQAGYSHWTKQKVRIWFDKNRSKYLNPEDGLSQSFVPKDLQSLQPPLIVVSSRSIQRTVFHFRLPPLPEDGISLTELRNRLSDVSKSANSISGDSDTKPQHPEYFKDAEVTFLECLKRFPVGELPPVIDGGATVIEMPNECEIVKDHPLVQIPDSSRLPRTVPKNCCAFYRGQYSEERTRSRIENVECAVMCLDEELVYTFYDAFQKAHVVAKGGIRVVTGFVATTTSIVVDDETAKVWIAGDFRVRAFDVNRFQEFDLLYVGDPQEVKEGGNSKDVIVTRSALAIWQDLVVLGHGQHLTLWKRNPGQSPSQVEGWDWSGSANPPVVTIERKRGRSRIAFTQIALDEPDVDCILAVGDLLAVASSSSPTIHIIRKSNKEDGVTVEIICRLIGHTMGVTALVSRLVRDKMELISGSRDGSIKIWSLAEQKILFSVQMEFKRRGAGVTTLHIGKWKNSESGEPMIFLFSGHLDKKVRVWDLCGKRMMFELTTGPEPIIPWSVQDEMFIHVAKTVLGCIGHPVPPETPSKESESQDQDLIPKVIGFNHLPHQDRCELFIMAVEPGGNVTNGELQTLQFQAKE
jgi:hypothetical protein